MRRFSFNTIFPALFRSIDYCRWLVITYHGGFTLCSKDLLEVFSIWNQDDVPVMEISKLHGIPLNVITGGIPIATNMVRVNRRLIPVDVKNGVFQGSRTGCSHGLADATRCHTSFSLYYVNIRSIITVVVHCSKSKPERCCHTNPRCTGG